MLDVVQYMRYATLEYMTFYCHENEKEVPIKKMGMI